MLLKLYRIKKRKSGAKTSCKFIEKNKSSEFITNILILRNRYFTDNGGMT